MYNENRKKILSLLKKITDLVNEQEIDLETKKQIKLWLWSAGQQVKHLENYFGWTSVKDELPKPHQTVLVSLEEENVIDVAYYSREKGFLLDYISDDWEVKAWCEVPDWYDFEEEREPTEEELKEQEYWRVVNLKIDESRGK